MKITMTFHSAIDFTKPLARQPPVENPLLIKSSKCHFLAQSGFAPVLGTSSCGRYSTAGFQVKVHEGQVYSSILLREGRRAGVPYFKTGWELYSVEMTDTDIEAEVFSPNGDGLKVTVTHGNNDSDRIYLGRLRVSRHRADQNKELPRSFALYAEDVIKLEAVSLAALPLPLSGIKRSLTEADSSTASQGKKICLDNTYPKNGVSA